MGVASPGQRAADCPLADRQTTGGYPIIAVVATVDLGYFAQCQPGQKVRFKLIDLPTAQTLLADVRQPLDELEQTVITANTSHRTGSAGWPASGLPACLKTDGWQGEN